MTTVFEKNNGKRANLSGSDLRNSNLRGADLIGANLSDSDLRGADLSGADLSGANLSDSDLSGADLRGADLSGANLSNSNLRGADLSGANLIGANLRNSNLRNSNLSNSNLSNSDLIDSDLIGANLIGANLIGAKMIGANLIGANLSNSNLSGANLIGANLSDANGLTIPSDWIRNNAMKTTPEGYVFLKDFSGPHYSIPDSWNIEEGSIISEVCNPIRTNECGCGVNVGTKDYVRRNHANGYLWEVLIRWEWLADVVVPYNTDGKIRCGKVEIIKRYNQR